MLIGDLIQRIHSLYSKGVHNDETRLMSRHIYNKLLSVRSVLLYNKLNKKQKVSQWNYQTIPCVEMITVPIVDCPCIPPLGCYILRSKYQLPKPIIKYNKHLIKSVTSLDGNIVYSEIDWEDKKYKSDNKYTANKPDYFIRNKFLYITTTKYPEVITITGLFQDPSEVDSYPSFCCNESNIESNCISIYDKEFPIDDELIDALIELSLKELIEVFNMNREDNTNNTQDNLDQENK